MRKTFWFTIVGIGLIFAVFLSVMYESSPSANGAPMLVVTPVAGIISHGTTPKTVKTFFPGTAAITSTTTSAAQRVIDYDVVDLEWVIDQTIAASVMNTTTLKLQMSNDGINWVDSNTFVNANVADVTDMAQYPLFGAYSRVVATVTNANPVTITVLGAVK